MQTHLVCDALTMSTESKEMLMAGAGALTLTAL